MNSYLSINAAGAHRGQDSVARAGAVIRLSLAAMVLVASTGSAVAENPSAPQTVSPGSADRFVAVSQPCPTFSWTVVEGALGYELAVYDVAESQGVGSPVLETTLPAGATSWTPSADLCLVRGAQYAWSVRSRSRGSSSAWSEPSFFQVLRGPTEEEFRQALETVNEYLRSRGGAPQEVQEPEPTAAADAVPDPAGPSSSVVTKAIAADAAAIRGELDDTAGASFGVLGVSNSPDGAGVAADNTAGGADVVLGGSVPALLTEAGISRSSSPGTAFDFGNPLGPMSLTVDSSPVFTAATDGPGSGLDADLVDGLDSTAFAPSSHVHDGRYFTEGELTTSGGGGAVHWDNLDAVPADLADGDNDTTYSAGPGLLLEGSQFSVANTNQVLNPSDHQISSIGSIGANVNEIIYNLAATTGSDGLPLVVYRDNNADLIVAHCENLSCTAVTTSTLRDVAGTPEAPLALSITVGADGFGLISYFKSTANNEIRIAHCDDVACTGATFSDFGGQSDGTRSSITLGSDGLGLVAYSLGGKLEVAHCEDDFCSSATISRPLDGSLFAEQTGPHRASVATGADGLALIALTDYDTELLVVARCNDIICSSVTVADVGTIDRQSYPSLTVGADGLGLVAWRGFDTFGVTTLSVAHCEDAECSAQTITQLSSVEEMGDIVSVTTARTGLGMITYIQGGVGLRVARCHDTACTKSSSSTLESDGSSLQSPSAITVRSNGLPFITYADSQNEVRVLPCTSRFCTPYFRQP